MFFCWFFVHFFQFKEVLSSSAKDFKFHLTYFITLVISNNYVQWFQANKKKQLSTDNFQKMLRTEEAKKFFFSYQNYYKYAFCFNLHDCTLGTFLYFIKVLLYCILLHTSYLKINLPFDTFQEKMRLNIFKKTFFKNK